MPSEAGSRRNLSDQSGHELDEISPVMQLFVIDWTPSRGVGSSFNPKDRASRFHFQRRGDIGFSWRCVQLVLGLNQRNTVFAFKERKDRVDFQVVGNDFLADLQGEVGLIEGEGNTIRQAHATNSDKRTDHKFLNSPPNGNAADTKSRNEAVFGRQLRANL